MPLVDITIAEGREPDTVRSLITALTDAVEHSLGAPRETVRVIVRTVPLEHWANGDVTLQEKRSGTSTTSETKDTTR